MLEMEEPPPVYKEIRNKTLPFQTTTFATQEEDEDERVSTSRTTRKINENILKHLHEKVNPG